MLIYEKEYYDDVNRVILEIPNIEKLKNKTVIITGGTGLICSSVIDILHILNKEYNYDLNIFILGRNEERVKKRFYNMNDNDYKFLYYDSTKECDINIKADYIIHGASNANPGIYTKEPVETMLSNVLGLNVLLENAKKNNIDRVLYISSSEVYGKKENEKPYMEDNYGFLDILNMRASYPSSKRCAETLCVSYSDEFNVDTLIVRPGHIYGPSITDSDNRASADFTRNAKNKENIVMKSMGTQIRSYCYSLDCGSAILAVLLNGKKGNAYNISNKNSVCSIRDIAEMMAKKGNSKVEFHIPSDEEKKGYNLMDNSSLDSSKLERLGWKAVFNLEEGCEKTLKFYKS